MRGLKLERMLWPVCNIFTSGNITLLAALVTNFFSMEQQITKYLTQLIVHVIVLISVASRSVTDCSVLLNRLIRLSFWNFQKTGDIYHVPVQQTLWVEPGNPPTFSLKRIKTVNVFRMWPLFHPPFLLVLFEKWHTSCCFFVIGTFFSCPVFLPSLLLDIFLIRVFPVRKRSIPQGPWRYLCKQQEHRW